jgi:hypothetical protein
LGKATGDVGKAAHLLYYSWEEKVEFKGKARLRWLMKRSERI